MSDDAIEAQFPAHCDACAAPVFVHVTYRWVGVPGYFCRQHAADCAGLIFTDANEAPTP
jgi:hypothetical protein